MHIARWILPITAAASVALLVGAIPASAGWSARVTATGSVTIGREAVTVAPTALSTVMTNDLYQTTYLVSVTNATTSTTSTDPSDDPSDEPGAGGRFRQSASSSPISSTVPWDIAI